MIYCIFILTDEANACINTYKCLIEGLKFKLLVRINDCSINTGFRPI